MVETRTKLKLGHEYGGQKTDEMILWDGGGRGSRVANTELVSARASKDEDDEWRKRRAPSVKHRARALEHQKDEEHEHHELACTREMTNARTHGHKNVTKKGELRGMS